MEIPTTPYKPEELGAVRQAAIDSMITDDLVRIVNRMIAMSTGTSFTISCHGISNEVDLHLGRDYITLGGIKHIFPTLIKRFADVGWDVSNTASDTALFYTKGK